MKPLLVYFIAILMFSTSALYFSLAIFGERIESNEARVLNEAHGLKLAERQIEGETTESSHNESQELAVQLKPPALSSETHNESSESPE